MLIILTQGQMMETDGGAAGGGDGTMPHGWGP